MTSRKRPASDDADEKRQLKSAQWCDESSEERPTSSGEDDSHIDPDGVVCYESSVDEDDSFLDWIDEDVTFELNEIRFQHHTQTATRREKFIIGMRYLVNCVCDAEFQARTCKQVAEGGELEDEIFEMFTQAMHSFWTEPLTLARSLMVCFLWEEEWSELLVQRPIMRINRRHWCDEFNCNICNLPNHPAAYAVSLIGLPYENFDASYWFDLDDNSITIYDSARQTLQDEARDEDDTPLAYLPTKPSGRYCAERAYLYHSLMHCHLHRACRILKRIAASDDPIELIMGDHRYLNAEFEHYEQLVQRVFEFKLDNARETNDYATGCGSFPLAMQDGVDKIMGRV